MPAHARHSAPHTPASPAPARFQIMILKNGIMTLTPPLHLPPDHQRFPTIRSRQPFRPFYKHRVYEAATLDDACRQALQDDDWEGEKLDDETAGEPYVTGIWTGEDAAYKSASLPIPTNGHASGEHKMQEVDLLLALLKRFASTTGRHTLPHLHINS